MTSRCKEVRLLRSIVFVLLAYILLHQVDRQPIMVLNQSTQMTQQQKAFDTTTPPTIITTSSQPSSSSIRFILFLGLEGTGHHLISEMTTVSRAKEDLVELKMHPKQTTKLYDLLFQSSQSGGGRSLEALWSSPCHLKKKKGDSNIQQKANVTKIENNLIQLLRDMKNKSKNQSKNQSTKNKSVVVPANGLFPNRERIHGMMSYPQFDGPCRPLTYPNLDVWYDICDAAGVQCQHIYLYRDPYEVVRSTTTKRNFNKDALEAIHLYTTLLGVLFAQLTRHASRSIGCVGLFDMESQESWQRLLQDLMGIETDDMRRIYTPPKPKKKSTGTTHSSSTAEIPDEIQPYMRSFVNMNEDVIKLCQQNLQQ